MRNPIVWDVNPTLPSERPISDIPVDSYTITQGAVAGWTLVSIVCTPATGVTTDTGARSATIALTANAHVSCTFTNIGSTDSPTLVSVATNPLVPTTAGPITLTIDGSAFNTETARIELDGPGCGPMSACTVPNESLVSKSPTRLVGTVSLPMAGTYSVRVRLGSSGGAGGLPGPLSNAVNIVVVAP